MRLRPVRRFCRLAATGLAVTGLLGHGLAMLLAALLVTGPASATAPFFGEICAAADLATTAAAGRLSGEKAPAPAKSHFDPCPVCTAFAAYGAAALPAPPALPGMDGGRANWTPRDGEALQALGGSLDAQPRAPPPSA